MNFTVPNSKELAVRPGFTDSPCIFPTNTTLLVTYFNGLESNSDSATAKNLALKCQN